MRRTFFLWIAVFGMALSAADALDLQAITAKPAAHSPRFDDKEAWPDLVGDECFLKQEWPKARLLIWPHAGRSFGRSDPRPDPTDPTSWIDAATGKPADAFPDMATDILLPDADKPYKVSLRGQVNRACRHVTVGRNATFEPGGGGSLSVFGNVWIRPGGCFYVYRTLRLAGGRHSFFRNDWPADGKLRKLHDAGSVVAFDPAARRETNPWSWRNDRYPSVCHFFRHDKPGSTTEFIGYSSSRDEVAIVAGTLIVARDSRFLCGGAAMIDVAPDAAIALMDGAVTGKTVNQFGSCLRMRGGVVSAGLPDRPVKRDARLGVGYCNWMNLAFPDQQVSRRGNAYDYGRFSATVSGKLIGYPTEGSAARLVFGWQRIGAGGGGRGVRATDGFKQVFAKLQPKITIWMDPETELANVRFEDLHRGGIVLPDATVVEKWENVTYGDGCLSADPKELIREYTGEVNRGRPTVLLTPEHPYTSM